MGFCIHSDFGDGLNPSGGKRGRQDVEANGMCQSKRGHERLRLTPPFMAEERDTSWSKPLGQRRVPFDQDLRCQPSRAAVGNAVARISEGQRDDTESRFARLRSYTLGKPIDERSTTGFYSALDHDDSWRAAIQLVLDIRGKRRQSRAVVDQIAKPTGASDDRFESIVETNDACVTRRWRDGQDRKRR